MIEAARHTSGNRMAQAEPDAYHHLPVRLMRNNHVPPFRRKDHTCAENETTTGRIAPLPGAKRYNFLGNVSLPLT
jgi:hypothetical protein